MEWISNIVTLVLGGAGTAAWFHWRRHVEKQPEFESIEKAHKLVSLRKELDDTNYTLSDLKSLENALMGRGEVAQALAESYEHEANEIRVLQQSTVLTQTDMNIAAAQVYQPTSTKLESVIAALKEYYAPERSERFDAAQAAWVSYRHEHAAFLASQYEGGSIQPLIHASALESVTVARIVELEAELAQARERLVPYREREQ